MKYDDERSEEAVAFLKEIIELSKKYGLSLAHEDEHGSFIVEKYNEYDIAWLLSAAEDTR